MFELIALLVIVSLLSGIIVILKRGFNEIVAGLNSIDERLNRLENERQSH